MNIHFDTEGKFPESYSEGDKLLGIVEFWVRFPLPFREKIIEKHGDAYSTTDGVVQMILGALQQVDVEKLQQEIATAKECNDTSKGTP